MERYEANLYLPKPKDDFQKKNPMVHTVMFQNKAVVDLQCGETQDGTSWAKAVLYIPDAAGDGFIEAGSTEPKEQLCGSWELEKDEITYIVNVIYDARDTETVKLVPRRPSAFRSSRVSLKTPLMF